MKSAIERRYEILKSKIYEQIVREPGTFTTAFG
jgi:hypothetical protein